MPSVEPSWRLWPQYRMLSRVLCFFWIHHDYTSSSLKKPIICAVCSRETKHMKEYRRRLRGKMVK